MPFLFTLWFGRLLNKQIKSSNNRNLIFVILYLYCNEHRFKNPNQMINTSYDYCCCWTVGVLLARNHFLSICCHPRLSKCSKLGVKGFCNSFSFWICWNSSQGSKFLQVFISVVPQGFYRLYPQNPCQNMFYEKFPFPHHTLLLVGNFATFHNLCGMWERELVVFENLSISNIVMN